MKLFSKDNNKAKDEKIIYIFVAACFILGLALIIAGMSMGMNSWLVTSGVLLMVTFVMFVPSIAYNIMRNSKDE